ncbi:MAG: thiamine phosphate synthase [Myxococcota bacterium]
MATRLPRIWIVTEPNHPSGPIEPVRQALAVRECESVGVQLRAKQQSDRQLLEWGRALRDLTADRGAAFFVNGRPDIARLLDADGVHLGERDLPVDRVVGLEPRPRWVGVSRHDRLGLLAAEAARADFAFLSPVFAVPQKNPPLGVEGFARTVAGISMPVVALGGIGSESVAPLVQRGAHGVAVQRAIYEAADPAASLRQLLDALDNPPTRVG